MKLTTTTKNVLELDRDDLIRLLQSTSAAGQKHVPDNAEVEVADFPGPDDTPTRSFDGEYRIRVVWKDTDTDEISPDLLSRRFSES